MFSDFLGPLEETRAIAAQLAARPLSGRMLQIMDPAEESLPYAGRRRFEGLLGELPAILPRVEAVRDLYAARLAAQRAGLADMAGGLGWSFSTHRTDARPETALLALWQGLAPA
jgi:uncharacterized protein (DUF58 family)